MGYHLPKDMNYIKQNELKNCTKDKELYIGEDLMTETQLIDYVKIGWDITCSRCIHGTNDPKKMRTSADGKCTKKSPPPKTKFVPGIGWVCSSFEEKEYFSFY